MRTIVWVGEQTCSSWRRRDGNAVTGMQDCVVTVGNMHRSVAADARKRPSRLHGNIRVGSIVGFRAVGQGLRSAL
jgi:hypothetical protein